MFLNILRSIRKIATCVNVKPLELIPQTQNYDWGKFGMKSTVAQIAYLNDDRVRIDPKKPYAELWMGDHAKGPSRIKANNQPLKEKLDHKLPFLFKVLSIRKSLSIQVHPNKTEAELLHRMRPEVFQDPNHKPEMAIALTEFETLCGFRSYSEIYAICKELPPLMNVLGNHRVEKLKGNAPENLREAFAKLVSLKPECVQHTVGEILEKHSKVLENYKILDVFNKLKEDHQPNDVGLLCMLFMNYMKVPPGQAIYIQPNQIHSYISGDCVECMASSDNVIRAGLTPKFKDVKQLLKSTNFHPNKPDDLIFEPHKMDKFVNVFAPPVQDFAIVHMSLPPTVKTYELSECLSGSILLMTSGKCTLKTKNKDEIFLMRGSVLYLPESLESFYLTKCADRSLEFFIALPNRFYDFEEQLC